MHTIGQRPVYAKARCVEDSAPVAISRWVKLALTDFKANLGSALLYGVALAVTGWITLWVLWQLNLGWALLPILAGGMLIGPLATVGLYRISRQDQGSGGNSIASPGQVALAGVLLMVFALSWVRVATMIFAVFFGLLPFAGFAETMTTLLSTPQGIATVVVGTVIGGLFAALGFAISVFSLPMLVDREIDCFSAMGLSFNATTHNFKLMICWAAFVCAAVLVGVLTGLVGMIFIFPLLGFATWHAYSDLFQGAAQ